MFFKGSRYANVPTAEIDAPDGRAQHYKKTRFIGPATPERMHTVTQGERLDLIAQQYFQAPERFWRICDANLALWPNDLIAQPGRQIAIPASEE